MDYVVTRFLSAGLTGVILSQTGSLIQMSTRNILASPSTLGFDGVSILWILIYHSALLVLGVEQDLTHLLLFGVPAFVVLGLVFSHTIVRFKNIERLILLGLTFNLFVGAVFSLWQFLFLAFNLPFPVELWFGHFRFANQEALLCLLAFEALFFLGWIFLRKEIYLFSLGKSLTKNYRLNQAKLYSYLFVMVSLGTFCVVSFFGAFSFLGLIFPIAARKLWFKRFDLKGEFIIGSFMNGAFLLLIDFLCYQFPIMGAEIPVGLIATAVGAVSLIFLLWESEILAKKEK